MVSSLEIHLYFIYSSMSVPFKPPFSTGIFHLAMFINLVVTSWWWSHRFRKIWYGEHSLCRRNYENKTSPAEILCKYHHHVFLQLSISIRDLSNLGVSYLENPLVIGVMTCSNSYYSIAVPCKCSRHVFPLPTSMKQKKKQKPQKIHCASRVALLQLV